MTPSELAIELAESSPWSAEDVQGWIDRAVEIQTKAGLGFREELIRGTFQVMLDVEAAGLTSLDLSVLSRHMKP